MGKNVYTTSATIHYLIKREYLTVAEVGKLINEDLNVVRKLKAGKQKFTKQHYFSIIHMYPHLEGAVEMFENIKLKDK